MASCLLKMQICASLLSHSWLMILSIYTDCKPRSMLDTEVAQQQQYMVLARKQGMMSEKGWDVLSQSAHFHFSVFACEASRLHYKSGSIRSTTSASHDFSSQESPPRSHGKIYSLSQLPLVFIIPFTWYTVHAFFFTSFPSHLLSYILLKSFLSFHVAPVCFETVYPTNVLWKAIVKCLILLRVNRSYHSQPVAYGMLRICFEIISFFYIGYSQCFTFNPLHLFRSSINVTIYKLIL